MNTAEVWGNLDIAQAIIQRIMRYLNSMQTGSGAYGDYDACEKKVKNALVILEIYVVKANKHAKEEESGN